MIIMNRAEMIEVTRNCNSRYDGKFYVGVISTGIYCLPSCKAKMPNEKNIIFFENKKDAINYGLRGCKRCKSDKYPNNHPEWFPKVEKYLKSNVSSKISDNELMKLSNVHVSTIRRYFKEKFGNSVIEYNRQIRLQRAKELISSGIDSRLVAYMIGYSSQSGFRSAFKRQYGYNPGEV
jgi:AraC family transcriptional regulator, regulatory protein of adaptative response / methylated-DNA-[protein]-cysteine methyltransferase